jgi:hypothetical protein
MVMAVEHKPVAGWLALPDTALLPLGGGRLPESVPFYANLSELVQQMAYAGGVGDAAVADATALAAKEANPLSAEREQALATGLGGKRIATGVTLHDSVGATMRVFALPHLLVVTGAVMGGDEYQNHETIVAAATDAGGWGRVLGLQRPRGGKLVVNVGCSGDADQQCRQSRELRNVETTYWTYSLRRSYWNCGEVLDAARNGNSERFYDEHHRNQVDVCLRAMNRCARRTDELCGLMP